MTAPVARLETEPCTVSLVEYGVGNIQSVANALRRQAAQVSIVGDGDALRAEDADCIVLPGVGAVGEALRLLRDRALESALNDKVLGAGVPFLGICVGMQMLATHCEEFGTHRGLGWIPGRVRRLEPGDARLAVPHVGWNSIQALGPDAWLAAQDGQHFYFVHSYAMECAPQDVAAWTDYGERFASAVARDNVMGVQFHPEKSSGAGGALLGRFLEVARTRRRTECSSAD